MIENGQIGPRDDPKIRGRKLVEEFGWDVSQSRKIWAFAPNENSPNILVDCTRGVQYLNEIKDPVIAALKWVTKEGVLVEEQMHGIRFDLVDVSLHYDARRSIGGQIIPASRRVFHAAQLTAQPRLMEPMLLVEIRIPHSKVEQIYDVLDRRRGFVIEEHSGPNLLMIFQAYMPIATSFGFSSELRQMTNGQASSHCIFDHWRILKGNPFEEGKVKDLIESVRKRKGIHPSIPPLDKYLDKL